MHHREPDTRAFDTAAARAMDAMKAFEEARHLAFWNADAGVADLVVDPILNWRQADASCPERELESVRQQVQYDPFPHARVDEHGFIDRVAIHGEAQTGFFTRGAERACKLSGERREI